MKKEISNIGLHLKAYREELKINQNEAAYTLWTPDPYGLPSKN